MRRALALSVGPLLVLVLAAAPVLACGALISPNGTVALVRTTTLAAYHDGVEHYVTGFKFEGGGGKFGSIVPLPGIPSQVIRGGNWTLQRLEREVAPPAPVFAGALAPEASAGVQVILQKKIDALDITVLKGGGFAVGKWATDHGFALPPDAPAVLSFYANRSPIFMAVEFDAKRARARGEHLGDAIPVHIVIPTSRPWVPLRILGLGAKPDALVKADVFLLTDRRPALLPAPAGTQDFGQPVASGLKLFTSEAASASLLHDLRIDRGMAWMPKSGMWLTFLSLDVRAKDLTYDLAVDPSGWDRPSPVDAGLVLPHRSIGPAGGGFPLWVALGLFAGLLVVAMWDRRSVRAAV